MARYRLLAFVIVSSLLVAPAMAEITGQPQIIDGDTLELNGQRIDLYGIDAPELEQTCSRAGREYPCGKVARAALWDLVAGSEVVCEPVEGAEGDAGAIVAECSAGGFSLNQNMVYTGWALADPSVSDRFNEVQEGAKKARRGLWRGKFEPPRKWRAARRGKAPVEDAKAE